METKSTISVLQKIKGHKIFDHIETISKDRDNKSSKVIEEIGPEICIKFDPGHFKNNFKTDLSNFIKNHRVFTYFQEDGKEIYINSPFYDLEGWLLKWMSTYLKEKCDDRDVSMCLGTVDYYLGDHRNCLHDENYECYFWNI